LFSPFAGFITNANSLKYKKPQAVAACGFLLKINFSAKQADLYKNNT